MALEEKHTDKGITLVRGADGALYLVNETAPPLLLSEDSTHQANEILGQAGERLTEILKKHPWFVSLSCSNNVKVVVPEVFP